MIGAAPSHDQLDDSKRRVWVRRLGRLNALAGDDFNRGLRAYYFGMAVMAWMVSAWAFILSTLVIIVVLARREFVSPVLRALREVDASEPEPPR